MHGRTTLLFAFALLTTALVPAAGGTTPAEAPLEPVRALQGAPSTEAPALERGLAVVERGTQIQADRAGLGPVDEADRPAVAASPAASISGIEELPAPVATALVDLIVAFEALSQASETSFAQATPPTPERVTATSPAEAWSDQGLDPGPTLAARADLLDAVGDLAGALAATEEPTDVEIHQPPGLVVDLSAEDDTYSEDVALLVDAGGDDTYENNAGGTGVTVDELLPPDDPDGFPAATLVDLGGDDTYGQPALDPWDRREAANGGGFAGVGVLVDRSGDDRYAAYADGVNGGAFAGVGLLLDTAGDDAYEASGWGANGGGYPAGIGQLVDLDGNDTYEGSYEAVNGGGALSGSGLLYDGGGGDAYTATHTGTNGGAVAGQGLLVDRGIDDDTYTATGHGVNGGAFGGEGLLYDEGGSDRYEDEDGGSGRDVTVLPKGAAGAQIDG